MAVDWQVESLRLSVFPIEINDVSPSKLWEQHIGKPDPEVLIQPGKINQRNAEHGNGNVYLVKTPNQIDCRYVIEPDESNTDELIPAWGSWQHEVGVFLDLTIDLLRSPLILPLNRIAFGAVLMSPAKDLSRTHVHLASLLPRFDLEDASEFNYLINRRRGSTIVSALQINRLSRWLIVTLERKDSTLDPVMDEEQKRVDRLFASRLELDINTIPTDGNGIQSESLPTLFEELLQMGLEIAEKGDVR